MIITTFYTLFNCSSSVRESFSEQNSHIRYRHLVPRNFVDIHHEVVVSAKFNSFAQGNLVTKSDIIKTHIIFFITFLHV
jgi:hypothetical protein